MRLNESLFNLVELKRNLEKGEAAALDARGALQKIAARSAGISARPKSKNFVSALLTHNARARRSAQPVTSINLHVNSPDGRRAVHIGFAAVDPA
jgi:hypothetical protein